MVGPLIKSLISHFYKLLALLLILGSSIGSHAANYIINSSETNVRFAIDNFKTASTTGGFYNVSGQ